MLNFGGVTLPFTVFHPQPSPAKLRDDGTKCVPTCGSTKKEESCSMVVMDFYKLQTNKSIQTKTPKHPSIITIKTGSLEWKDSSKKTKIHCFKGHHFHLFISLSLGLFRLGCPDTSPEAIPCCQVGSCHSKVASMRENSAKGGKLGC